MTLSPGDPVRCVMTKWGGRPHWEFAGTYLGGDEHGDWLGFPAGTPYARPGAAFVADVASVTLVPRGGASLPTFHAPGIWCSVYVDMTTEPVWDGAVLRAVDLDLDVIRGETGRVWVDDEDEFADHKVRYGYPPEVVAMAERTAAEVHDAVLRGLPPYDAATSAPWLARVSGC
ncbi:DUF402 domain-containing protein [Nocardioides dongkuii]|uniref:DUF402 domain-containing protein n=1 Tax=Nocardioides dongkuii TaxID=2760089 RepID=UPI0015FAD8FF|nr:DUF402 domain-containing protein [Nocardioides dongkuii]